MQWLPWQATTVPQKHEAHFFQEPLAHSAAPLWKHIRKYVRIYAAVACASVESTFVYIHIHIYIYIFIYTDNKRKREMQNMPLILSTDVFESNVVKS
jgi:hypothetical protein